MPKRVLLPFLLALLATLAVFAAITWFDRDTASPPSTTFRHQFDPDPTGPVWVTVTSTSTAAQTVTLSWGDWTQTTEYTGRDAVTYVFAKPDPGLDPAAPLQVKLPRGGDVTFGQGAGAPAPSVSLADGWLPVTTTIA